MKHRLLMIPILLMVIISCSYHVPLSHQLVVPNSPQPKYDQKILVVMSRAQAQKVIEYSPQLGDTYVFKGGPALKDLVIDILGQLYKKVAYAESRDMANTSYDLAVEVSLKSHEISMNIYKGNTVKLGIDYTIYDPKGTLIKNIPTHTSSMDKYSGGELVTTFVVGAFYNIGKMKEKTGAAWDKAAINSIGKLIDHLLIITKP
ncbi:MAG: hypothetical protein SWH54_06650 [Thermodesulfobacteriota bacterium]|nr:hypothetical protein [Thermodesulfobacteriota bacterium]